MHEFICTEGISSIIAVEASPRIFDEIILEECRRFVELASRNSLLAGFPGEVVQELSDTLGFCPTYATWSLRNTEH
jgi:hypothetical protein